MLTIYGKRCVALYSPLALHPRLFAKALDRQLKPGEAGCLPIIATRHTLRVWDSDGNGYDCPFKTGRRGELCYKCPHSMRKKLIEILPPSSVECELYDARKMSVKGDCKESTHIIVLDVDMPDVIEMNDYAKRIPKSDVKEYNRMSQVEKIKCTNRNIERTK